MIGPLVGHGFITAVESYAEASGSGGGPAALAQGLSPLDGILVPTFGAYDIAVTLLFPFVAIRLISASDRAAPGSSCCNPRRAWAPPSSRRPSRCSPAGRSHGFPAFSRWFFGNRTAARCTPRRSLNLLLGHLLRLVLASGIAVAAAAIANGAASAAIVTLGFTVGTWALDFVAAGRGGLLARIAAYTPTAALRVFEQGQLRLATVVILLLHRHWRFLRRRRMAPTRRPARSPRPADRDSGVRLCRTDVERLPPPRRLGPQ